VSWIHEQDFARAVEFLIVRDDLEGPVNLAAPHPLPNRDFMAAMRDAWACRTDFPTPSLLLEIGAFFLRTESELVLKSRRVVPRRLLEAGFEFQFQSGLRQPRIWSTNGATAMIDERRDETPHASIRWRHIQIQLLLLGVMSVTGKSQCAARISNLRCSSFLYVA